MAHTNFLQVVIKTHSKKKKVSYYESPCFLDPSPRDWIRLHEGEDEFQLDYANAEGVVVMAQMLSNHSSTMKYVKLAFKLSAPERNTYRI